MSVVPARIDVWLYDRLLRPVAPFAGYSSVQFVWKADEVGVCELACGAQPVIPLVQALGIPETQLVDDLLDCWLVAWRTIGGNVSLLFETAWQIRYPEVEVSGAGRTYMLQAYSAQSILGSRYMLYASGSSFAEKSKAADDLLKDLVDENFVNPTDFVGIDAISRAVPTGYLSVEADRTAAPNVAKGGPWQQVSKVIEDVAEASREHDTTPTPLYYDVVVTSLGPGSPLSFQFRTYTTQRGIDRTAGTGAPVEFSLERGNLLRGTRGVDARAEWNYAVAAGQGEEETRSRAVAYDTTRMNRGPFSRREYVKQATNVDVDDSDGLQDAANTALAQGLPKRTFDVEVIDVPGLRYGPDWSHGDRVVAVVDGERRECLVDSVTISFDEGGEHVSAELVTYA